MEQIDARLGELIQAIRQGDIYQDYLKATNALNEDEELKRQVDDLRSRNFKLQKEGLVESMFEKTSQLEEEFCEVRKNLVASKYLDAELALCKMLKEIRMKISDAAEFDLPS